MGGNKQIISLLFTIVLFSILCLQIVSAQSTFFDQSNQPIQKPRNIAGISEIISFPKYYVSERKLIPYRNDIPDYIYELTREGCVQLAWNHIYGGKWSASGNPTSQKDKMRWASLTGVYFYEGKNHDDKSFWFRNADCSAHDDVSLLSAFYDNTRIKESAGNSYYNINVKKYPEESHPVYNALSKGILVWEVYYSIKNNPSLEQKYIDMFFEHFDLSNDFLQQLEFTGERHVELTTIWSELKNNPKFSKNNCEDSFNMFAEQMKEYKLNPAETIKEFDRLKFKCEEEGNKEYVVRTLMVKGAYYRDIAKTKNANDLFIDASKIAKENNFEELHQESYALYLTTLYELGLYKRFAKEFKNLDPSFMTDFLEEKKTMFCILNYAHFDVKFNEFKRSNAEASKDKYEEYIKELKDIEKQCAAIGDPLYAKSNMVIGEIYRKIGDRHSALRHFLNAHKIYNKMELDYLAQPALREYIIQLYRLGASQEFLEEYENSLDDEYKTTYTEELKKKIEKRATRKNDEFFKAVDEVAKEVKKEKYNVVIVNAYSQDMAEFNNLGDEIITEFFNAMDHEALAQKEYQDKFNFVKMQYNFPKDFYDEDAKTGLERKTCYELWERGGKPLIEDICVCSGKITSELTRNANFDKILYVSDTTCRGKTWTNYAVTSNYKAIVPTAVHEMGHLLFFLGDEYSQPQHIDSLKTYYPNCQYGKENSLKTWGDLMYEKVGSPVPLEGLNSEHKDALIVDSYASCGWNNFNYKPTRNSVMNNQGVFPKNNIAYAWGPVNDRKIKSVLEGYES